MNKPIIWTTIAAVLVIAAFGWWYEEYHTSTPTAQQACTLETQQCPDGTYVGRTGPNCEFAACPGGVSDMKSATDPDSGISFVYPEKLPATYITAVDWPPKVAVENHALTCTVAGTPGASGGQTSLKTISGRQYCITLETEGAAGSIYNNYAYATEDSGKTYIFTFSTRVPQCANYDDPQKTACMSEQSSFNLDGIIDSIVKSAFLRAS